ncbi:DUF6328 family protein [Streptomyces sp. NPDC085529]|uniref:DUF6328 family protein n=1 Tax=Streptomyces sp. NPDC085529 TaxID=3365729 RepID=UPI0037D2BBA8
MDERDSGAPGGDPSLRRPGDRTPQPDTSPQTDTGTHTGTGTDPSTGTAPSKHDGRGETEQQRADRRWQELLQEIRVAQTGVQILLGFLLTVVFTPLFHELQQTDKTIYLVTVVLGSLATGALIGPVSFHRIVSGRRVKPQAVVWASRLTFTGILLLLATLTSALFLILRVATHDPYVPWLVSGVLAWYLTCWFALPLWVRAHYADGN